MILIITPTLRLRSSYHHRSTIIGSSYRASVANAPNVLQQYWLIVLPLDIPALNTSLLYKISAARGGIIYRPKDVPTCSTSSALLLRPLNRECWSCRVLEFYQLSPLVVFKRSWQPKVELCGYNLHMRLSL
jgi:hypothetical protein